MGHQLTTLASGVTVVTESMPAVRSASVGMWVGIGSRDEAVHERGCSHFLEHLLFKGTGSRSAREIAETLDAVGGEMNAFTSKEVTCFYARVLDEDLPVAFDVLADMLVDATNTEEDVEAERQVVLSELDIHFDTPEDLVHTDFTEAVLGTHPLAVDTLGTVESVAALTRDGVHAYYLDRYRPHNLVVAAAGNVDHDRVVALADSLLGDLDRPGGAAPRREPPQSYGVGGLSLRQRPTEQVHLVLGTPGLAQDDDDRWALRVLNEILGGGMASRLFQEIRETRGLAYTTYSHTSSFTDSGLFGAYAGTTPGKVDEVVDLLREELDRIGDDVTNTEVERAKGSLTGATVLSLEDTGSRMSRLGRQVATATPIVPVDEALEHIAAVDLDAVRAVAARVLGQPRNLAVVGPFADEERDRFLPAIS